MTDETPNPNSEAPPDGAPAPGHDPNEVMSRASTRKLVSQRDELKKGFDKLTADFEAQGKELEALRGGATPAPKPTEAARAPAPSDMPEWGKALVAKIEGLGSQFDSYKTSSATGDATKAILAQVPDGAKETVKVMLPGLGVDLTSSTAVADAMAALTTHHPSVMVDHSRGTPRRAPQPGPNGKLNFDGFATIDDIPSEHRPAAFADPATLQRLVTGASGATTRGGDGFNI